MTGTLARANSFWTSGALAQRPGLYGPSGLVQKEPSGRGSLAQATSVEGLLGETEGQVE